MREQYAPDNPTNVQASQMPMDQRTPSLPIRAPESGLAIVA
jgi:hypothetical protein